MKNNSVEKENTKRILFKTTHRLEIIFLSCNDIPIQNWKNILCNEYKIMKLCDELLVELMSEQSNSNNYIKWKECHKKSLVFIHKYENSNKTVNNKL